MKSRFMATFVFVFLVGALVLAAPRWAMALGTQSGTPINNKATINYNVGGVVQTPIESSLAGNSTPGAGNGSFTQFVVDKRVTVTVAAEDAGWVSTYPGSANQALEFTVTNSGNDVQDFGLAVLVGPANTFTATTVKLYRDTNASFAYEAGVDAEITTGYIDELGRDASMTVFIVPQVPPTPTAVDGQFANYALSVTTREGGVAGVQGAVTVATGAVPDTPLVVDVVFGDADGDGAGVADAVSDGKYVKWGNNGCLISAANLTISKTSAVISDPVNGISANAKAIPGALIEYTITITHTGGTADATSVQISDAVDGNLTFDPNGYAALKGIKVSAPNIAGSPKNLTNLADVDEGNYDGVTKTVTVNGIDLTPAQSATVTFRVTIN